MGLSGVLSTNETKHYHPPKTQFVEPNVDHDSTFTWHWISTKYHGLVGGCARLYSIIQFLYHPQFEDG